MDLINLSFKHLLNVHDVFIVLFDTISVSKTRSVNDPEDLISPDVFSIVKCDVLGHGLP